MWLKVDDAFITHDKVMAAAEAIGGAKNIGRVVAVWLEAATYSSRNLTDGFVRRVAVDAFITDTFDPATGASGATGKTHDWTVSRRLVERSPKPVILAGGLTPGNVRNAIRKVRPAGVDVHTGVEGSDGRKRRDLVRTFVAEARAGFASLR